MAKFGMYPAVATPFHNDGSIDFDSLEKLVRLFSRIGCEGIFAVCPPGGTDFLSDEEKLALAEKSIAFSHKYGMKCAVSGHTQGNAEDAIAYLASLEALSPDAIVLMSNRLAAEEEDDAAAAENLEKILSALKKETKLGICECPHPYKCALSKPILEMIVRDGRFRLIMDTSENIGIIRERLAVIDGSGICLYNTDLSTLPESMKLGCAGFSGGMINLLPEFFGVLVKAYEKGDRVCIERCMEYLLTASAVWAQNESQGAEYVLMQRGIFKNAVTRNGCPPLCENQTARLDAFIRCSRRNYYSLLMHVPYELLTGYDRFFGECHASTVVSAKNGNVLVAYFAGSKEGKDDVAIWLSMLEGGEWKKPRVIAKVKDIAHWNPVLFETDEGIRLVFKVGKSVPVWVSYTMLSKDNGVTWSDPELMNSDNPAGGPVKNKPIVLSDGRMLAPNSDEDEADVDWVSRIDESTDGGKTFQKLAYIPLNRKDASEPTYMTGEGAIQPTLWESAPGKVHALIRTAAGYIFRSDSEDGGKTWCTAYPTSLANNNSGLDLVNVNGTIYLVLNPDGENWGSRTPLIVMKSVDNGETFEDYAVLCDNLYDEPHGRTGEFSYPSVVEKDGSLHIVYTHNRKSVAYSRIDL